MKSFVEQLAREEVAARVEGSSSKLQVLMGRLSSVQRQFILDNHRLKVAVAGRRGGKSVADCTYMIKTCVEVSNAKVLYLGLTRDSAKEAVWDELKFQLALANIPHQVHESKLRITFPKGGFIQLVGADIPKARDRLRGRAFHLVIVDECGFVREVDELITAVLPALADYRGTLCFTSSPPEILQGLFYEASEGASKQFWKQYHWTMKDNPHFQKPAPDPKYKYAWEEEFEFVIRTKFGGNANHPGFKREYLGLWVQDDTSLVYPYETPRNRATATHLAMPEKIFGMGIDFGWNDYNAIVIGQFSSYSRNFVFVEEFSRGEMLNDELAAEIQRLIDKYNPVVIVADTGGYGKSVAEELKRRYSIPLKAAEKDEKLVWQRQMRNDMISGYVKAVDGLELTKDWQKLMKDPLTGKEKDGQDNHRPDAGLYLYRYAYTRHLQYYQPKKTEEELMLDNALKNRRISSTTSWVDSELARE